MEFERTDPDVLKKTGGGGGCLFLFGLPFFLVGLFVLGAGLGIVPVEGDVPWYVAIPFGGVFAAVGLGLMTGRSGLIIDRRQGRVVSWYGLLVPMKRKEYFLDYYDRVSLRKERRSGDKRSYTVYPVRLEGRAGAEAINLEEPQDYQEARKTAEDVAKFLSLRMEDYSSGSKLVREADRLDETIREKTARTGEYVRVPIAPPDLRADVTEEPGTVTVEVHPPGLTAASYVQMAFTLIFVTVVFVFFGRFIFGMKIPAPFNYIVIGVFSFLFILMPIFTTLRKVLGKARRLQRITATPAMLIVEDREAGKSKVTEIPVYELEDFEIGRAFRTPGFRSVGAGKYMVETDDEDLQEEFKTRFPGKGRQDMMVGRGTASMLSGISSAFGPSGAITARSDKVTVSFGQGLRQDELEYIHAKLKNAMMQ